MTTTEEKFPLGKMYKLRRNPTRGVYRTLYADANFGDIGVWAVGKYILEEPFVLLGIGEGGRGGLWIKGKILTLDGQVGWTDLAAADLEPWK